MSNVTNASSIPSSSNVLNPGISSNLRSTFLSAAISIKSVCERPQTMIAVGFVGVILCITGAVLVCITGGVGAVVIGGVALTIGAACIVGPVLHVLRGFCSGSKKSNDSAKLEKPSAPLEVVPSSPSSSSSSASPNVSLCSASSEVSLGSFSAISSVSVSPLASPKASSSPSFSSSSSSSLRDLYSFTFSSVFSDLPKKEGDIIKRTRNDFKLLMQEINSIDKDGNMNYQKVSINNGNRDVYINHNTGVGFKVFIGDDTEYNIKHLKYTDLRLNEIYSSEGFYEGRYKDQANYKIIDFYDDAADEAFNSVTKFRIIPGFEGLGKYELIPKSALNMLEDKGFEPYDVKRLNYIKVKYKDGFDYIPIDAKYIGIKGGQSFRSTVIEIMREEDKGKKKYYHGTIYIDETK